MNKQWMVWAAAAAAVLASGSAMAQRAGDTVFGAGVMHLNTQDKGHPLRITSVGGRPVDMEVPGSGSSVNNATTMAFHATHFLTDNVALEGVLGVPPKFKLYGEGTFAPIGQLGSARQWSPAFLAKYYFGEPDDKWRFFGGVGVSYVKYGSVRLTEGMQGALAQRMGLPPGSSTTSAKLSSSWAPVFNLGVGYQFNKNWGAAFSVSYLPLKTKAHLTTTSGGRTVATSETRMRLNPVVPYLYLTYKF